MHGARARWSIAYGRAHLGAIVRRKLIGSDGINDTWFRILIPQHLIYMIFYLRQHDNLKQVIYYYYYMLIQTRHTLQFNSLSRLTGLSLDSLVNPRTLDHYRIYFVLACFCHQQFIVVGCLAWWSPTTDIRTLV